MPKWIDDLNKAVQEAEKYNPVKNALNAGVDKLQQNVNMITPDMNAGWQTLKGLGQIGTNFAGGLVNMPDAFAHPIEAGKQIIDMGKQYQKDYLSKEGLNNIKKDPSKFVGDTYNMIGLAEGARQGVKALNTPKPSTVKANTPPVETYKPKTINKSMGGDAINIKPSTRSVIENNLKNYEAIDLTKGGNFPEELNALPTEFQVVYHSSPIKGIKEFNPVEHFGNTDPGFYAKNATYFSPEVQNSIPYGARINADAYFKNPKTHSDWVKNQIGYLANEATDIYSGTINPERFKNSIINEIEYRNNVGDINKANELKAALNDYNGNTVAEMGSIYKTQIPADKYLLNWDKPISEQSSMVKEIAKELNISPSQNGEILYNNLLKQYQGNAIEANQFLNDVGIYGFTGGDTIGIEKGIFNPKRMRILEENSVLSPQYREYIK